MITELLRYIIYNWHTSFLLTLAVEVPLFVALTYKKTPLWRSALAAVLCSCVTHPLLWFQWRPLFDDYLTYVITGELLVAVVESLIFYAVARPVRLGDAIAASCIANGASYGSGLLIYWGLGYV